MEGQMLFTAQDVWKIGDELKLFPTFALPFRDGEEWTLDVLPDGRIFQSPTNLSKKETMGLFYTWILTSYASRLGRPFSVTFTDLERIIDRFQQEWALTAAVDVVIAALKEYLAAWVPQPPGAPGAILSGVYR